MVKLIIGDAIGALQMLPSGSVNCCVTSPPYWGLRDYGTAKWDGGRAGCDHVAQRKPPVIESSSTLGYPSDGGKRRIADGNQYHEAYKAQFREICRKCGARRVDAQIGLEKHPEEYVARMVEVFREVRRVLRDDGTLWLNLGDSYCATTKGSGGHNPKQDSNAGSWHGDRRWKIPGGLKPKDLVGIPWRVAFALQADGWYLRSDIIWHKPNPMPESVTDRPTKAHEYLFLLSKSARYYYDADGIREPFATDPKENYPARARIAGRGDQGAALARGNDRGKSGGFPPASHKGSYFNRGKTAIHQLGRAGDGPRKDSALGRNRRSVWTVNAKPFKGAHFATFPPKLIEPCILAGCPNGGTVLDPFGGAGTTALVAKGFSRNAISIDLNPEYVAMQRDRLGMKQKAKVA